MAEGKNWCVRLNGARVWIGCWWNEDDRQKRWRPLCIKWIKIFITNGGIADIYVVFALTDPESKQRGTSAFIVESDTPGFSVGKKESKLGIRSSPTTEIMFEDCRIPVENLLGKKDKGLR